MGTEFGYMSLVRVQGVLLIAGATFALVLLAQIFELRHAKSLSSSISAEKVEVDRTDILSSWESLIYLNSSRNSTDSGSLNVTNLNVVDLVSTITESSNEMVTGVPNVKDDSDPENIQNLDGTSDDDLGPEDELTSNAFLENNDNLTVVEVVKGNCSKVENFLGFKLPVSNYTSNNISSPDHDIVMNPGALPPSNLQILLASPDEFETNPSNDVKSTSLSTSTMQKEAEDLRLRNQSSNILIGDLSNLGNNSFVSNTPAVKGRVRKPKRIIVPISRMNELQLSSYEAVKPRWFSAVDQELRNVKSLIENAAVIEEDSKFDFSVYRNFSAFKRSYALMEKIVKVYIYAEGERPIFHQAPIKGIYASEGWFMKQLKSNKRLITKDGTKAHLFYLPFSSVLLDLELYVRATNSHENVVQYLGDYVNMIMAKYSFWNRTGGADHFLVACHDWAAAVTRNVMGNCIRSLCNNDINEGFRFGKDASLPETNVRTPQNPLRELGGRPSSQRRILAFFAGKMHGSLRPILLNYWENKDPDMKIFGDLREMESEMSYSQYMKSSKYCICARGNEVSSPRVVEAIFYECVPVIISNNYVPPFFETLNWESFAVFVMEKDIPNLKNILLSIPKKRYQTMQQRVKRVQQHFLWHSRPVKYDLFNMILHSIWYNRVFRT